MAKQRVGLQKISGGYARQRKETFMSVIRSKRHISKSEYENTFTKLYHFGEQHTSKVANRRKRWLCREINDLMNDSYNLIMEINERTYHNTPDSSSVVVDDVGKVLKNLCSLQKPLLVLWNVEHYETKKMVSWCKLLQDEWELLTNMTEMKYKYKFKILDYNALNKAEFLKNMSEFHRFVHGKVINAPCKFDDTSGQLLIKLVDSVFFSVIKANSKVPTNHEEYVTREKYISKAISDLYKLQRQSLFYCNLMQYSDSVLMQWSKYLNTEIKLLTALKKSDSKRFGKL